MRKKLKIALYSFVLLLLLPVSSRAQVERKVAVFDPAGTVNKDLLEVVREEISSSVVNYKGYTVLERQLINKVMEENRFQESGLVSDEQVSNIGRLMGADYVIVSTVSALGANYHISCKMIEVATARIEMQSTGTTISGMNDITQTIQNLVKRMFENNVRQQTANRQNEQTGQPAQTSTAQRNATAASRQVKFKIGIRAGFNLTGRLIKRNIEDWSLPEGVKYHYKPGFQIGVVGEYAFNESFALQPGIVFATQGHIYKRSYDRSVIRDYYQNYGEFEIIFNYEYNYKSSVNYNYIQIPINAQYKLDLGRTKLLLQAGPYIGYAISGKFKWEETGVHVLVFSEYIVNGMEPDMDYWKSIYNLPDMENKGEGETKFGSEEGNMNPFDYGIGLGVGLEFGAMQVGIGYNLGLADHNNSGEMINKHRGFSLTVIYLFGK